MTNAIGFTNTNCRMEAFENLENFRKPAKNRGLDNTRLTAFIPEPYPIPKQVRETMDQYSKIINGPYVLRQELNNPSPAKEIINQLARMKQIFEFISQPDKQKNIRLNDILLADTYNQIPLKTNTKAREEVRFGRAVPYFAGYFDAIAKPSETSGLTPEGNKLFVEIIKLLSEKGIDISKVPKEILQKELEQIIKTHVPQDSVQESKINSQYKSLSERMAKKAERRMKFRKTKASRKTMKLFKQENKGKITLAEYKARMQSAIAPENKTVFKKTGKTFKSLLSKAAAIIF